MEDYAPRRNQRIFDLKIIASSSRETRDAAAHAAESRERLRCLVLGTFITEWKGGTNLCQQFLASEESVRRTVDCLVSLSLHYGFDGWLINIENRIPTQYLHNLKFFLQLLTNTMRKTIRYSRVIWYDSVTVNGELKWQNMLNELNRDWYDNCDGIYLNYNWDDEMLLNSADFGAINRIFVGVDCFARGCVGGWDCDRSFAKINLLRMSVALFAPGWVCEKFPNADPIEHGLRFWKKLALYTPARPILELPVSTNFCTGFSNDERGLSVTFGKYGYPRNCFTGLHGAKGSVLDPFGRLFNFDVKCNSCRITIRSDRDIKVIVNNVEQAINTKGEENTVTIVKSLHLRSIDIRVDNEDCLLYHADVVEI